MAEKRIGEDTIFFSSYPTIIATASTAGKKEGEGPCAKYFDKVIQDPLYGESTWEKAESKMLLESVRKVLEKARCTYDQIHFMFSGDLLNQITASNFAARELPIPFYGLFGACSTFTEGLTLGGMAIDGGFAQRVLVGASSHYQAAERQYRYPTELGVQRPPTAQRTVTGAGAVILGNDGPGPFLTAATIGRVIDMGISDPLNMGTAMAPAAVHTIVQHFKDTGRNPDYYDVIITGDLASVGKGLAEDLLKKEGYDVSDRYTDCGVMIYKPDADTQAGGSGCACSAVVFSSYFYPLLKEEYQRLLLVSTGALMSPTTYQQGETIPAIAHAVAIERNRPEGK
ncbi:MAG: stage V sporulation protein AD [Firmicutes bacterium]|nr:stage V sporulation protein AD [Bacillota bacterium]